MYYIITTTNITNKKWKVFSYRKKILLVFEKKTISVFNRDISLLTIQILKKIFIGSIVNIILLNFKEKSEKRAIAIQREIKLDKCIKNTKDGFLKFIILLKTGRMKQESKTFRKYFWCRKIPTLIWFPFVSNFVRVYCTI